MSIYIIFYFVNSKKRRMLTVSSKSLFFYLGCSHDQSDITAKGSQGNNSWRT